MPKLISCIFVLWGNKAELLIKEDLLSLKKSLFEAKKYDS
jgi:hypothetical protein